MPRWAAALPTTVWITFPYREATKEEVNAIYQKVMAGETCTVEEAEKYQTYILIHLGKQYHRLGIAMQIHYNCLRWCEPQDERSAGTRHRL